MGGVVLPKPKRLFPWMFSLIEGSIFALKIIEIRKKPTIIITAANLEILLIVNARVLRKEGNLFIGGLQSQIRDSAMRNGRLTVKKSERCGVRTPKKKTHAKKKYDDMWKSIMNLLDASFWFFQSNRQIVEKANKNNPTEKLSTLMRLSAFIGMYDGKPVSMAKLANAYRL